VMGVGGSLSLANFQIILWMGWAIGLTLSIYHSEHALHIKI